MKAGPGPGVWPFSWDMLQLVRRAELAPRLWPFIASATGFSPPRNKPVAATDSPQAGNARDRFRTIDMSSNSCSIDVRRMPRPARCPNTRRHEAGEIRWAPWKPARGELRSLEKLKHVPRGRPNTRGERRSPAASQGLGCGAGDPPHQRIFQPDRSRQRRSLLQEQSNLAEKRGGRKRLGQNLRSRV